MDGERLDGKAELEKAIAQHDSISHFGSNLLLTDDAIDWNKIVITGPQPTISFGENTGYSIEFENRDALLEALCQKVFGAKPIYKQ